MVEAAGRMDFIDAARLRDEVLAMEESALQKCQLNRRRKSQNERTEKKT